MEKQFPGRVRVDIFPSGQLYNTQEAITAVATGTLEIAYVGDSYLQSYSNSFSYLGMPGSVMTTEAELEYGYKAVASLARKYLIPQGFTIVGIHQNELLATLQSKPVSRITLVQNRFFWLSDNRETPRSNVEVVRKAIAGIPDRLQADGCTRVAWSAEAIAAANAAFNDSASFQEMTSKVDQTFKDIAAPINVKYRSDTSKKFDTELFKDGSWIVTK